MELPLADKLEQVILGASNKKRIWDRLKHYYRGDLKHWMEVGRHKALSTFNVFAAKHLGGLGVNRYPNGSEGVENTFTNFQLRIAKFLRDRWNSLEYTQEIKNHEMLLLTTQADGAGLSYQLPSANVKGRWIEEKEFDELQDSLIQKDVRSLPVLSECQKIDHRSWVKRFSTRSLKLFRNALACGIVSLDHDPSSFPYVYVHDRQTEYPVRGPTSGPIPEFSQNAQRAKVVTPDGQQTARESPIYKVWCNPETLQQKVCQDNPGSEWIHTGNITGTNTVALFRVVEGVDLDEQSVRSKQVAQSGYDSALTVCP